MARHILIRFGTLTNINQPVIMFEHKIKSYLNSVNTINLKHIEFKEIQKGDIVELQIAISKNKIQRFKGICIKKTGSNFYASLTIEYKISNELVQQKFPIALSSIVKITRVIK